MAFQYEHGGTVSLTKGSTTVIGSGTNWVANYPGLALLIDNKPYLVASVDGAAQLTLTKPYPGTTAAGVTYELMPTQPETYQALKSTNELIDTISDLIESGGAGGGSGLPGEDGKSAYELAVENGFSGSEAEWLASLKGEKGDPGEDGAGGSGESGLGSIVNLSDYAGQPAGGTGVYMIVPVSQGEPGISLTQSAQVVLPLDKPNAGIGMWINSTASGYAITLGLTNAPLPQPDNPTEPVDLSGNGTIYGDPGTIIPLGISVGGSTASFTIDVPSGLPVKIEHINDIVTPVTSTWQTGSAGAPYPATGDAVGSAMVLNKGGDETKFGYENGHVVLNHGAYLFSDALALQFATLTDETKTQTPPSIRLGFKGVVPAGQAYLLNNLGLYGVGGVKLGCHWDGVSLMMTISRNGSDEIILGDIGRSTVGNYLYEAEWIDDPNGTGGTVRFYVDGVQVGPDYPTETKPRITPAAFLECNVSAGNEADGVDDLEVEGLSLSYGKPATDKTYTTVSDGAISAADLEALVVDARSINSNQAAQHLTYTADGTQTFDLTIVVGPLGVPAGRAYKAVLEDWSTGVGVPQANELVMTKPVAQNCKFEDAVLFGKQASWTEVLPQGAVPNINGINYYCEGIRMGNYVQFQFGYDWDSATMPNNPFGDPTNKESYMVPHKWMIYDKEGTLLARIEKPNGEPLNATSSPAVWQGSYDGRGVAMVTSDNPWYPHGTVRSGIIWRSHDPVEYSQEEIWAMVPTFDIAVPYASQTGYSVNGFDLRIYSGGQGDGQANGFGNYRWMPWEASTYNDLAAAGLNTLNPYKTGSNETSVFANVGTWLKYTPFNQAGRSPITAPGGTRDDRQIMAEPVARYARDVTTTRLHDNRSMKQIALDYLTAYVSDPYQCFESGRLTPLYKGNARRPITARNHYYGGGEASTPESQAYYNQSGRTYEWSTGQNPLRVKVPFAGLRNDRPVFGTNTIDEAHAHQFPHWGSMLFQTPEFAFLGHKFFDQTRLYMNEILNSSFDDATGFAQRGSAWKYMHAALAWKTASKNSSRLYSREEVLDFVIFDFESFYDRYYASDPGFLNPPASIGSGESLDLNGAVYAAASRFGPVLANGNGVYQHDFMIGYWLSALHAAERLGFNEVVRNASAKAKAVLDWLFAMHMKRITGRINDAPLLTVNDDLDYDCQLWSSAQITSAGGIVANLPQTYAAAQTAQGSRKSASWDTFLSSSGQTMSKDGQAIDQLLAGPFLLNDIGKSGAALDTAIENATTRRQQKIDEEDARGFELAGSEWFKYHQTTNNPPFRPS